jgi:hypothetical protein
MIYECKDGHLKFTFSVDKIIVYHKNLKENTEIIKFDLKQKIKLWTW